MSTTKREFRANKGLELRDAAAGSPFIGTVVGYAAVFNSDSVEFPGYRKNWVERIDPGAFARSLREKPDVVLLWAHDSSKPVARTPASLRISEDERGLRVEADLPDTTTARDLWANLKAGIVDSMSFGFEAKAEEWVQGEERDTRTLKDVDLLEVSAVVWPAYPDTSLALRNAPRGDNSPAPTSEPDLTELQAAEDRLRVLKL